MIHTLLFDGTANGRDDVHPTNIRLLHEATPGSHYFEGPGNSDNFFVKAFGGGLGAGCLGIISDALTALAAVYKPGDKICVIGFSRGAGNARRAAFEICEDGVNGHFPGIEFLGCFDTVFAATPFGPFQSRALFGDLHVHRDVKFAAHAVSLDENRKPFIPNLMNAREGVSEVWFRGCHSDIGGGYEKRGLADITLHWMLDQVHAANITIDRSRLPSLGSSPIESHLEGGFWGSREARRVGVMVDDEWSDNTPLIYHCP